MSQVKSLWIGDLDPWVDEERLKKMVQSEGYGQFLVKATLIRDKVTTQSCKYGFLEFVTTDVAQDFINKVNGRMMPGTQRSYRLNWAASPPRPPGAKAPQLELLSIYVKELDPLMTEYDLLKLFKDRYASVHNSKIIIDLTTKMSKGYGFVHFTDSDEAQRAIREMNGQTVMSKQIKVAMASHKPKGGGSVENLEPFEVPTLTRLKAPQESSIGTKLDVQLKMDTDKSFLIEESERRALLRQTLESIRCLTYTQTLKSQDFLRDTPIRLMRETKRQIEERVFS